MHVYLRVGSFLTHENANFHLKEALYLYAKFDVIIPINKVHVNAIKHLKIVLKIDKTTKLFTKLVQNL